MTELLALFLTSFAAATLIPLPSEAALWGYLMLHPDDAALAVGVATVGNTLGGMTTYLIGRLVPQRKVHNKAVRVLHRWGAPATFFAWLPIVGDALSAGAGWLRVNAIAVAAFMAAGRLSRYIVVAAFA